MAQMKEDFAMREVELEEKLFLKVKQITDVKDKQLTRTLKEDMEARAAQLAVSIKNLSETADGRFNNLSQKFDSNTEQVEKEIFGKIDKIKETADDASYLARFRIDDFT